MRLKKTRMLVRKHSLGPACNCYTGTYDADGRPVHFADCALIEFTLGFRPNFTESREHEKDC